MKVELVGVSQGVSFAHGPQTRNFLDFRTDTGKIFRISVDAEAFDMVLASVYGGGVGAQSNGSGDLETPAPEHYPDAVEFGGDEAGPDPQEELLGEEKQAADNFVEELQRTDEPGSEEEVPSL